MSNPPKPQQPKTEQPPQQSQPSKEGPSMEEVMAGAFEILPDHALYERVFPYEIAKMPIEKQATYADKVCRDNVHEEWLEKQVLQNHSQIENNTLDFSQINANSIGNIAYIALNSNNPEVREASHQFLINFKTWANRQQIINTTISTIVGLSVGIGISALLIHFNLI